MKPASNRLQRLARTCYRRRRTVTLTWIALLVGLVMLNNAAGGRFLDEFDLPGSESQEAFDFLEANGFGDRAGFSGQIVFAVERNERGVDEPIVRAVMTDLFADVAAAVDGVTVVSPYLPENERQISRDRAIAYAEVNFSDRDSIAYRDAADAIKELKDDINVVGLTIALGGDVFLDEPEFSSEAIGLLAAMIILLIAFGSLLAMGLPLMTAIFGIGTGIALVGLVVNFITMPSFSNQAVAMIGIGVGIDYALFIVTRYRESLHEGLAPEAAVVRAIDTSGRAVLFAGTTVIIAVLGLFVVGLAMIRGLAVGISLGVLMTMLASVTLLPAVLGFVGRSIDRLGLPHRRRMEGSSESSFWFRWSRVIQRNPWPPLLIGAVALIVIALPVFSLRMGFGDAGNRPTGDTTRIAFGLISEGFGPGFNGPLLLAASTPNGAEDRDRLTELVAAVRATEGVAFASDPIPNEAGKAAIIQVIPTTSSQDIETEALVRHLRADVIPPVVDGTAVSVKVGGVTAAVLDFAEFTGKRLPWFMATVLLLSFLLLMMVFRSILVPLKAVAMNLLSIGAAYGILVAVFQWGWGASLIGVGKEGPIEAWAPMMLFAIVFGLSMDYEVFLLSRIREDYDRTGDNATAVANGLAATARVITAAAAIMFFVFFSFVLGADRSLKLFGLGLSMAVLLDATIVRMVLVPATMELLGDRNWWLPGWLDRLLPKIHVDVTDEAPGLSRK